VLPPWIRFTKESNTWNDKSVLSWTPLFPGWSTWKNSIQSIAYLPFRNHVLLESIRALSTQAPIVGLQERQGNIPSLESYTKVPQWAAAIKVVVLTFKEQHLNDPTILSKRRYQGMWLFQGDNLFVLVAIHILTLPETLTAVNDSLRAEYCETLMTPGDLTRPQYVKLVMNILNEVQWPPSKRTRQEMSENNHAQEEA
jgi:hypothetical protein